MWTPSQPSSDRHTTGGSSLHARLFTLCSNANLICLNNISIYSKSSSIIEKHVADSMTYQLQDLLRSSRGLCFIILTTFAPTAVHVLYSNLARPEVHSDSLLTSFELHLTTDHSLVHRSFVADSISTHWQSQASDISHGDIGFFELRSRRTKQIYYHWWNRLSSLINKVAFCESSEFLAWATSTLADNLALIL